MFDGFALQNAKFVGKILIRKQMLFTVCDGKLRLSFNVRFIIFRRVESSPPKAKEKP
jgi:hypothetical protein